MLRLSRKERANKEDPQYFHINERVLPRKCYLNIILVEMNGQDKVIENLWRVYVCVRLSNKIIFLTSHLIRRNWSGKLNVKGLISTPQNMLSSLFPRA